VIDIKTASRKPSGLAADHALQLATYAALARGTSGATRIDTLVGTKEPQLVQIKHAPGEAGRRLSGTKNHSLPQSLATFSLISSLPRLRRVCFDLNADDLRR